MNNRHIPIRYDSAVLVSDILDQLSAILESYDTGLIVTTDTGFRVTPKKAQQVMRVLDLDEDINSVLDEIDERINTVDRAIDCVKIAGVWRPIKNGEK